MVGSGNMGVIQVEENGKTALLFSILKTNVFIYAVFYISCNSKSHKVFGKYKMC